MNLENINPSHNIYLIRVYGKEGSLIKLGYSSKINDRLLSYYAANPLVEIVGTYYREDALEFERELHKCVKANVRYEWYTEEQLEDLKRYIKKGIPDKIKGICLHSPDYNKIAKQIKNAKTTGEKLDILNSIYNKKWKEYLTYGLEKNKVLINVKQAKEFYESRNDYKGIILAVRKLFKPNNFYSSTLIKDQLQDLYDKKSLNRKAKSTDLYEFFELDTVNRRIDGKLVKGILIHSIK